MARDYSSTDIRQLVRWAAEDMRAGDGALGRYDDGNDRSLGVAQGDFAVAQAAATLALVEAVRELTIVMRDEIRNLAFITAGGRR